MNASRMASSATVYFELPDRRSYQIAVFMARGTSCGARGAGIAAFINLRS
jgi:hypothetical protein